MQKPTLWPVNIDVLLVNLEITIVEIGELFRLRTEYLMLFSVQASIRHGVDFMNRGGPANVVPPGPPEDPPPAVNTKMLNPRDEQFSMKADDDGPKLVLGPLISDAGRLSQSSEIAKDDVPRVMQTKAKATARSERAARSEPGASVENAPSSEERATSEGIYRYVSVDSWNLSTPHCVLELNFEDETQPLREVYVKISGTGGRDSNAHLYPQGDEYYFIDCLLYTSPSPRD